MAPNRNSGGFRPRVEALEDRTVPSTLHPGLHRPIHHAAHLPSHASHGSHGREVFAITLTAINGSGVSGSGTVIEKGDKLDVRLEINGLTPNLVHQMHIHGFGDPKLNTAPEWRLGPQDRNSLVPTPANTAGVVPATPDLMPGLISEHQAEAVSGPEMVDLSIGSDTTIYPAADGTGHLSYHQKLDAQTPTKHDVTRLALRVIEVHGAYVTTDLTGTEHVVPGTSPVLPPGATYVPLLPVAGGHLVQISGGTAHHAHSRHHRR